MLTTNFRSTFAGLLIVLFCIGCGEDGGLQTVAPPNILPPSPTIGFIVGNVVTDSGLCISDVVVKIVAGPNAGQEVVQKGGEGCSIWGDGGFQFTDLPLGVTIRLRATKKGYHPEEVETMAITSGRALNIVLRKL